MAPVAITSSLTSPPGPPIKHSQISQLNQHSGVSYDSGANTPYSSTSTAVSEAGDSKQTSSSPVKSAAKVLVSENLPSGVRPGEDSYYTALLSASKPTAATKEGSTVYGSAVEVLEALALKHSKGVWVYDDAAEVGFGKGAAEGENAFTLQTREGAGQEIAGYARKLGGGKISVFAGVATLPYLVPHLDTIDGDVIVHLSSTVADDETLALTDKLPLKALANLPDGWDVVFSRGKTIVETAAKLYGSQGKVVHVVEATYSGRETTSFTFPAPFAQEVSPFAVRNVTDSTTEIFVVPSGHVVSALPSDAPTLELHSLYPEPSALLSALSGKSVVKVVGETRADADVLKSILLSTLYSAPSTSSSAALPAFMAFVPSASTPTASSDRTIAFYTAPTSPLPALLAHLFLSSPSLTTRLASFGSSTIRGALSILALSPSSATAHAPLTPSTPVSVAWLADANLHKATDVLASLSAGGILVLDLPWTEEEVPIKLSRSEIATIKEKNLRVFLLDLNPDDPLYPIKEQVAFLLLYTGSQQLPHGVRRVLEAFHSGQMGREEVEEAQAGLIEQNPKGWEVPELEEGKVEKIKSAWEWDALSGDDGLLPAGDDEPGPVLGSWDLATRHLLFSEAFSVPDVKAMDDTKVNTLRPSQSDETFLVTVTENRRLTPMTYDRNVFHLELDTAGTGLKYDIGEAIGIHGWNDAAEVSEFCEWYGLDPQAVVTFPSPIRAGTMESRTVFQLLQQNIDLFGRPGKAFYAALSKLATSKADAMTLKFISAPEGAELFKHMSEMETVTFADVLQKYKTARPSIEELVGLIPEIKPRHYSIASSQKAVGDKVELLIVTVDWLNSKGSPRFGQCTRYLAALQPGAQVTVSIKPSVMKLPPDDRQPIIMAGLGTGAAPFRAFMQHRAWQRSQGVEVGPLIYYFGSRYRSQEYLYGEEIEAYIASGIISHAGLAFSRDGKDKVYIQHKMLQDKEMLADMLLGEAHKSAYFYLCGPTWPVPDVFEALVGSLQGRGMGRDEAEKFIDELKEEERYVLEVY